MTTVVKDPRWRLAAPVLLLVTLWAWELPSQGAVGSSGLDASPSPAPVLCAVEPRPLAFFEALATPSNRLDPRDPKPVAELFQDAEAAPPPDVVRAIVATAEELRVCTNAYDVARAYALYTDDYWRRKVRGEMDIVVFRKEYTDPNRQDLQYRPWRILEARQLADERVGAMFAVPNPVDGIEDEILFVFAQVNDRWLIDDVVVSIGIYLSPEAGTPTA